MNRELAEIINAASLNDIKSSDFLILSGSPEERCLGSISKIKKNFKSDNVFILKYSHSSTKREKNLEKMRAMIHKHQVGPITEFEIDEETPLPIISDVVENLINAIKSNPDAQIIFDITTLIKWHLLMFLRALDVNGLIDNCMFIYTEPKDYLTDLFQPLSFGLRELFPVPLFSGNYEFSNDCLLAILLGYEGDRAMALLDNIDPSECVLFIPKPAYYPEWEGRTEEMNKEIINIVGTDSIYYIDSRNPSTVAGQIDNVIAGKYGGYNCLLSPMGTKPQTVGLYLYWASHRKNNSIIYSAPLRHNDLFYSEGIGRTWILPVT